MIKPLFQLLFLFLIIKDITSSSKRSGNLRPLGDIRSNPRVRKEAEAEMNEHIRRTIEHFKQDDPVGLPSHLSGQIPDPMPIPNMDQDFSGIRMKFEEANVLGLSKFRLDHVESDLSALKVSVGVSIDVLEVVGKYSMSSWFTTSKGNFNVTILDVKAEAEGFFIVDEEGIIQVDQILMDLTFADIQMEFENLGFLGKIFQGMINSVGSFIFDSIKPVIFEQIQGEIRGAVNSEAKRLAREAQQFPNSINPLDMAIASARELIRERGMDPLALPPYTVESWAKFTLDDGILNGLATIHRTGSIILSFEKNVIHITLHVGAKKLGGKYKWTLGVMNNILRKEGVLGFTIDHITAELKLTQPANLEKIPKMDRIELELGNIAVLSDGAGTLDYVLEAFFNVIPNIFRKEIVNSLEPIVAQTIQDELQKLNLEQMIEDKLKE